MSQIEPAWIDDLRRWDPEREIELRAVLLHYAGQHEKDIYFDEDGVSTADTAVVSATATAGGRNVMEGMMANDANQNSAEKPKCCIM